MKALPNAPAAAIRPHPTTRHGVTVVDPYFWLKDQGYPQVTDAEVLDHLKAENAYFEAAMAPHTALVETLFEELKGRIKDDEASVPAQDGDFLYWWAFAPGGQYRKWFRKPAAGGDEQLILDEPALAEGKDYFRLGGLAVSPDSTLIAWAVDDDGSERFKLRVAPIGGGAVETISDTAMGGPVWASDSLSLAYAEVNEQWRPFRVRHHALGATGDDAVLYEEADPAFFVGVGLSQDRSHFVIRAADHVTSEVRLVPAADPASPPILVSPRQAGREYEVDIAHGTLFIRANDTHENFRIATAPLSAPGDWSELIAGSDRVYIRGLTAFARHLAITERVDGLDQIRLRTYDGDEHRVPFPEASYTASLGTNPAFDPPAYRIGYTSMVTPETVYDYDADARGLTTLKVREVPSGYDPALYATERLMAPARDGALVPLSIVYRRGLQRPARVHLYAYGAYGHAITPSFSGARLSLLDRGFAYAIAHIRGGDDLGYRWYTDGKAEKRWNTFHDFTDCAKHLVASGWAEAGGISISGGSAGGELMGVVANTDPELWRAVVAHVPFVDVLNTMQDESLPLTPIEWPEWGNPIESADAFALIHAYSPYENVEAQPYPPMLITGGLNDPRVTYWEPAKWAARLRATKTDDNAVLLKINMGAGHGGKSGRFESLRETAEEYAFVLAAFDLA